MFRNILVLLFFWAKKKEVCLRSPDWPYIFAPTLIFFFLIKKYIIFQKFCFLQNWIHYYSTIIKMVTSAIGVGGGSVKTASIYLWPSKKESSWKSR